MTDKLSREELMQEFQRMFARWGGLVGKEKQAYEQIKSIIEEHPRLKEKISELESEVSLLKDVVANPGGLL